MGFRRGADAAARVHAFEELHLPLAERRQLCFDLLGQFGARNVTESRNSEILHSCTLPFGGHARGDQRPSARLNFEKLTYNCWSCGGGGFLWWVGTMLGEDTSGGTRGGSKVVEFIRKNSGAGGAVQELDKLLAFLDSLTTDSSLFEMQAMPKYDAKVLDPWCFIHPYLTEFRHVRAQNVIDARVGYGTISVRMEDDTFKPSERIIVPHFWKGDLVGWQSRRLLDDGTPKWLSTPALPKDYTLFNYDPGSDVVVVEAPLSSVARRHQAHLEATFGSKCTDRQKDLIAAHTGRVILFMDNDEAGWLATEQVGEFVARRNANVWVVENPWLADPADLDDAEFDRLMRERVVPFVLWSRPKVETLMKWEYPDGHPQVRHEPGAA
jgi:hypothetical protein